MGFFDRLAGKKSSPSSSEASTAANNATSAALPQLVSAREKLEAKDLAGALAIYEDVLRTAGDRADVLVTISGDLGSCGFVEQIAELIAPRYDAERHGPATGLNLLQAYLATRNTTAAQHLLDILFGLQRPELEERLYGFSNALAELIELEKRGQLPASANGSGEQPPQPTATVISLVTISRPIWSYGIESLAALPPKEGKLRRVAFTQLSLPDLANPLEAMKQPEEPLGRLTRGLPLWLAETMYFSQHYAPIAALGISGQDHLALFGPEWNTQHLRQLTDTSDGLDYVFTGALRHSSGDFELILRLWEIKKFRERKTFSARWTPSTAAAELLKLQEQLRLFMEWQAYPVGTGLAYTAAHPDPLGWCGALAGSTALFLAEKGVLKKENVPAPAETLARVAEQAPSGEVPSVTWLAARGRAARLGLEIGAATEPTLVETPLVQKAREALETS